MTGYEIYTEGPSLVQRQTGVPDAGICKYFFMCVFGKVVFLFCNVILIIE